MRRRIFPSLLALCHNTVHEAVQRFASQGFFPSASERNPAGSFEGSAEEGVENDAVFFVDGTCGNGHDTLMLARLRDSLPHYYRNRISLLAFDIQEAAITATHDRLAAAGLLGGVSLLRKSHEQVLQSIPPTQCVAVAIYNLGYLPGCLKDVVTQKSSTLASLKALSGYFLPGGLLSVYSYAGHTGGAEEAKAVDAWFCSFEYEEWAVARYAVCNRTMNSETLYLAERRA